MRSSRKKKTAEVDEVEEMIKAAEDELLLKLSVDSHISSSYIDADLERRFQALKKPPSSSSKSTLPTMPNPKVPQISPQMKDEDPLARFAALKGPLPSASVGTDQTSGSGGGIGSENDVDEVDKIIQWAIDAARLDPSPASDDEAQVDDDEDEEQEEEEYSEDEDRVKRDKKGVRK